MMKGGPGVSQDLSSDDLYYANGVNASTGTYIEDPLTPQKVGEHARGLVKMQSANENRVLKKRATRASEPSFRAIVGIDERDLGKAGWGVVFAKDANPGIKDALQVLLDHRKEIAGNRFKVYEGDDGFLSGDTWNSFRRRHRVSTGQANPKQMPYYMLLVGDPETIPYHFQYQLDVERAVGRVHFDRLEHYACYAQSVVEAEKQPVRLPRRATFFGTRNQDDRATLLSSKDLVAPLAEELAKALEQRHWHVDSIEPADASKARLSQLLGGAETPALLFTATHGAGFNQDDPCYPQHQGALVTKEWPGPREWRQRLPEDFYFSASDVGDDAHVWGLIGVFFACFGAGTPRLSDFFHLKERRPEERLHLAEKALLAPLPQRLLSHPKGGALAVVGHIERAWTASFKVPGVSGPEGRDLQGFEQLLSLLMRGYPLGAALEEMNSRYAQYSTELTDEIYPVIHHNLTFTDDLKRKAARLWTANHDARNYIVVGDPAVRLMLSDRETALAEHPTLDLHASTGGETVESERREGEQPLRQPETELGRAEDEADVSFLPLPVPPEGPFRDEVLYGYWREHIKAGFEHNEEMFRRILKAFLGPYHATVWMYGILFAVGVLSFVTAAGLSIWFAEPLFALVFGGLSAVAFLSFFIRWPLRSLEENLEFITWLGIVYNTYWTRTVYAMDLATVQADLQDAAKAAIAEIERLIDKHAALGGKRRGPGE
jgi:hypothetical protein